MEPMIYKPSIYKGAGVYKGAAAGGDGGDFIFYNDFSENGFNSKIGVTDLTSNDLQQINESYFTGLKSASVVGSSSPYFKGYFTKKPTDKITQEYIVKVNQASSNSYCVEIGNNALLIESYGGFLRLQIRYDTLQFVKSGFFSYNVSVGGFYYGSITNTSLLGVYNHIATEQYIEEGALYTKVFFNGMLIFKGYINDINFLSSIYYGYIESENNYNSLIVSLFCARDIIVSSNDIFPVPTNPYL